MFHLEYLKKSELVRVHVGVLKEERVEKCYKKGNRKNNGFLLYDPVADNTRETKTGQVTENKGVQKLMDGNGKLLSSLLPRHMDHHGKGHENI